MKYNSDDQTFELSVRELCETALMRGNLDYRKKTNYARMREGAEIHRKLQAGRDENYHSEVSLQNTSKYNGIYFFVSGRADGVITSEDGSYIVEEIKTVSGNGIPTYVSDQHYAQLKCYGYFLACAKNLQNVTLRLTYFCVTSQDEKHTDKIYSTDELRIFYSGLLEKISQIAEFHIDRSERVLKSAEDCLFPYSDLREGQSDLMRECFLDIKNGERLFAEAPTGIGKTISTLYPAVKALGKGYADKIFYLTAKSSTAREAENACDKLSLGGCKLRSITLTAKEQLCFCRKETIFSQDGDFCAPDLCPYASGYYDRVSQAIFSLLRSGNNFNRENICKTALEYKVCPYELSLDLSEFCDIIICDYNYVFSPTVYLRRYFDAEVKKNPGEKYIFLIDEAHNLAERARDIYSHSIKLSEITSIVPDEMKYDIATGEVITSDPELVSRIDDLALIVSNAEKLCESEINTDQYGGKYGFYISRKPLDNINSALDSFRKFASGWLKDNPESIYARKLSDLCSSIYEYSVIMNYYDEKYLSYVNIANNDLEIGIFCLDPSGIMDTLLNRAYSSVLFSATLTPIEYFTDVLAGSRNAVTVSFPSPFPKENLCVAVTSFVSTRYEDRDITPSKIASCIAATVSAKAGNYIAYFPSYKYMEKVYAEFTRRYPQVRTVMQKKNMSHSQREEFLGFFREDTGKMRIGFCVLGGSFSEGVDLPGSRLIGSIIIGVGLPGLSNLRNIIRDYFEEKNSDGTGYDYAYTYPGIKNVFQAAGRVIRTENDRGIVALIDDRYMSPKYARLINTVWKNIKIAGNPNSLAEIARSFWKNE